jgi:enoyl-CoA hydratase/carnithine racemase
MNSRRGFIAMPAVDLGMYFRGVGVLPRLELQPPVARKIFLEGHRFNGEEALGDELVDFVAPLEAILVVAYELAIKWAARLKLGELVGSPTTRYTNI